MKVVILTGGLGTRFSEETDARPKPMVETGGRPILMSDVTFDMKHNNMEVHQNHAEPWRLTLVDTGDQTMTGADCGGSRTTSSTKRLSTSPTAMESEMSTSPT